MNRSQQDGSKLRSDSTIYRKSKNFLDSNSKLQGDKKWLGKRKLSRKLEKLITVSYRQKFKAHQNQQLNKEEQLPSAEFRDAHLRNLLSFSYYHSFTSDGNSFYRILGTYHLYWLISNPQQWEELMEFLRTEKFDIYRLTNIHPDFMPYWKKTKVIELFKALAEGFKKKLEKEKDANIIVVMGSILNTYTVFDFAIIAIYRLVAFYKGYEELEIELSSLLEGSQRTSILVYGTQVTPVVIKILSECFKVKMNIYSVSNSIDFEYMCYTPSQPPVAEFNLLHKSKSYSILAGLSEHQAFTQIDEKKEDEVSLKSSVELKHKTNSNVEHVELAKCTQVQITIYPKKQQKTYVEHFDTQHSASSQEYQQQAAIQVYPSPVQGSNMKKLVTPTKGCLPTPTLQNQRFNQAKSQEQDVLEQIYNSMSEKERKQLVIQHLRRKFEAKYLQVKLSYEQQQKKKFDLSSAASERQHSLVMSPKPF